MNHQRQSVIVLATSALACAFLAGCPFDKPEDHLARGKELAGKAKHGEAIIELKNYLQSTPRSAEGRYLLGRELLIQGDARAAEGELQKAYDGRYNRELVVPMLVRAQILQGQPERISNQIVTTELKTPQANAELQSLLGTGYLLQGKSDEALKSFQNAQNYLPDFAAARVGEARVRGQRGEFDASSALVATVLAKEPKNVEALILQGDIARARDQSKEAIDAYVAAIAEEPRNVTARLNLAGTYVATNALDAAAEQVVKLKQLAPRHPGTNYLDALIAFNRKDYLRANDAIALSLQENPESGAAHILSGAIAIAMKQPAQAELHLVVGIKKTPNSIYARQQLTGLYLRQHQPQKAVEVLRPALQALPNNTALLGLASEAAIQMGDYATASKLIDQASKADPADSALKVRGATLALARGDEAAGFDTLEAAAKTAVDNPNPEIALVVARLTRRQYDQALVAWQNLEKIQPDNPITYNLRAAIDIGRNDRPAAYKALERAVQLDPTFFVAVSNLAALDELAGNVDAARGRYKALLEKDKTNLSGLTALAQFEQRHGAKPEVVLPLLIEARRANPDMTQATTALIGYYVTQNRFQDALSVAQDSVTRSPNNDMYKMAMGDLQLQSGSFDQAIATYRQLVATRPDLPDYQLRLGRALVAANQAEQALPVFASAIKAAPDVTNSQSVAMSTLLSANKVAEASRLVADIRKIAPRSRVIPELEGDLKLAAKQYADAEASYRKAATQSPSSELVIKHSFAAQLSGKQAESSALIESWLKGHPNDVTVLLHQSDLALQSQDYSRAAKGYAFALRLRPDDPSVLNNLAWAMWRQKDPQALSFAKRASALAPNSPLVNDTVGWIMVEQGDVKGGVEFLERANASAPGTPQIALHLAKAQIRIGRKDAARATLQALVKSAPNSVEGKESKDLMATL